MPVPIKRHRNRAMTHDRLNTLRCPAKLDEEGRGRMAQAVKFEVSDPAGLLQWLPDLAQKVCVRVHPAAPVGEYPS